MCQRESINEDLELHLGRTFDTLPKINAVILSTGLNLNSMSPDAINGL